MTALILTVVILCAAVLCTATVVHAYRTLPPTPRHDFDCLDGIHSPHDPCRHPDHEWSTT